MIINLSLSYPWIWLIIFIVLIAIEAFTFSLTTIWFALGALAMILISLLKIPFPVQLLIWLILSSVLLYFTRPYALSKLKVGKEKTNVDSLVGKSALVVKTITKHEKGEIKINGLIWSAKTENEEKLEEGSECEIVEIQGATALVKKIETM